MIFKISYLTKIYVGWPLLLDGFLWLVGNTGEERIITFPNSMACWFHGWVWKGASCQNFIQIYSCKFAQKGPSVLFSHSSMSDSLWSHGLQRARFPCPSPTPGACSNLRPTSWWCHPTILSSVVPFSCLQFFLASGCFPRSQFFGSGGQSFGASASASASVFLMTIQDWFPFGLTGLISLQSKGLSRVFSNATVQKHQFISAQPSLWANFLIHTCLLGKP